MKKLLSVLMAAAMLVGVLSLAGCGGNGGETTTLPTLTTALPPPRPLGT